MNYLIDLLSDYPDLVRIALIPMIVAILAIALPLLIQTISRIEDKYNSTNLIVVFKKESIFLSFWIILVISILSYFLWVLQLSRFVDFGVLLNDLIDNSALILIFACTISLVFITLKLFNLILTYYQTEKLFKRLSKKYKKSRTAKSSTYYLQKLLAFVLRKCTELNLKIKLIDYHLLKWLEKLKVKQENSSRQKLYFEAISSILFFSIEKADEPLARKLLEFYFESFINFRKSKEGNIVEYPQEYYDAIFEANGLLCMRKRRPISYFNDSTLFALFIDEYQATKFSPTTFKFLWKLIIQTLYYEREDFIFSYWKKAHQLFNIFLKPAEKIFNEKLEVSNQEEIDEREKERGEFLEFHYALGGYLMFLGKYNLIEKIINWTNQSPPKYVLVPETMKEVIDRYMKISSMGKYSNPVYFEQKYPFPEISGVNADDIIQTWIKRYLSILFLRQYTLNIYYTFSKPLEMPNPPRDLSEMKHWDQELDSLNLFINDYLTKKDLLLQLGLIDLSDLDWFSKNNKEKPDSLIGNLKDQIKENFEKIKKEQKIDEGKEKSFQETTKDIILSAYHKYSDIFTTNVKHEKFKNFFIYGRYEIMDKAGFATHQEIGYVNSDSIVAEMVAMELSNSMLNAFVFMNKIKYTLKDEDLFYAIDKLEINSEDFVIIAIGLNLFYYQQLKINGLINKDENWAYNNIKIIDVNNSANILVSQSLFVIRKIDLPNIIHNEINQKIKDKFKLDEIDHENHIYTKIINLNDADNKTIREEIKQKFVDKDLSEKVVVCVDINTEIRYKIDTKCIQLKSFSQFEDRGVVNNLSDIKRFDMND